MHALNRNLALAGFALCFLFILVVTAFGEQTITNVSYDPTRELYKDFNAVFAQHWADETGGTITIQTTHGGSGSQARTVIDGLEADVVTLALEADINAIAEKSGKIDANWRGTLPNNNAPYTSTIVFLVRKGNPKGILDWGDLIKDGVEVITPNPKTSGAARWGFVAAWAWANAAFGNDEQKTRDFVSELYRHVPVLDSGARGSTTTFVQRGIGDVLLSWENEAFLAIDELGPDAFDIVVPSVSVLAEPPVAIVDQIVDKRGTREVATAYLDYLYTAEGQTLAAKHYYRPSAPDLGRSGPARPFSALDLVRIDDFGGWKTVQPGFFGDGGVFDQIYAPSN